MASFLPPFVKCDTIVIKENQSILINEISNSNRKNSIHFFNKTTGFTQLEGFIEEMRS